MAARRGRITTRLEERDDFGIVLLLILATIMTISLGAGADRTVRRRVPERVHPAVRPPHLRCPSADFRAALAIVVVAVAGAAVGLLSRRGQRRRPRPA